MHAVVIAFKICKDKSILSFDILKRFEWVQPVSFSYLFYLDYIYILYIYYIY